MSAFLSWPFTELRSQPTPLFLCLCSQNPAALEGCTSHVNVFVLLVPSPINYIFNFRWWEFICLHASRFNALYRKGNKKFRWHVLSSGDSTMGPFQARSRTPLWAMSPEPSGTQLTSPGKWLRSRSGLPDVTSPWQQIKWDKGIFCLLNLFKLTKREGIELWPSFCGGNFVETFVHTHGIFPLSGEGHRQDGCGRKPFLRVLWIQVKVQTLAAKHVFFTADQKKSPGEAQQEEVTHFDLVSKLLRREMSFFLCQKNKLRFVYSLYY